MLPEAGVSPEARGATIKAKRRRKEGEEMGQKEESREEAKGGGSGREQKKRRERGDGKRKTDPLSQIHL